MLNKNIIALIITLPLVLGGCTVGEKVGNTTEKVAENIKDGGEGLVRKVTDTSMEYTNTDFNKALEDKGYNLKESETDTTNLSVQSKNYTLNGETVTVYEYDTNGSSTLESDLGSINSDGTIINGTKMEWANAPHIYKKGRIVVVYDGKNESVLTTLNDLLGSPLIG